MPAELKQRVIDAAKKNGRDWDGDIVHLDGVSCYVNYDIVVEV